MASGYCTGQFKKWNLPITAESSIGDQAPAGPEALRPLVMSPTCSLELGLGIPSYLWACEASALTLGETGSTPRTPFFQLENHFILQQQGHLSAPVYA